MSPANEEKLFSAGCLLVLIGVCVFGYLALHSHWLYSAVVAALIGSWMLVCRIRFRRDHRRHCELLTDAFANSGQPTPLLKDGMSYGFPSITLVFSSEDELKQAQESGRIEAFKHTIQLLHKHRGTKRNPFNAECAVWATYRGWKGLFTAS